ncbi:hypothetical protein MMC07_003715 [Pseudocyphellaria aurata]|nr:hypothetical protein [Pseudocyphellaria aurata]
MPSARRVKLLVLFVAISIFMILYLTNHARRSKSPDFYASTVAAMNAESASGPATIPKLKDSPTEAKGEPGIENRPKSPLIPDTPPDTGSILASETGEKSVAGRKKMKGGEKWDMATGKEAAMVVDKEGAGKEPDRPETQEEHNIEVELNSILKKGPIIIFSKSWCPYSKKAKSILLEKYSIIPSPYVVELDQHHLGAGLQSALEKSTGRRTVPNVLINGKSIGGGDDVEALDVSGELVNKVKAMGGKRIMEAKLAT